MTRFVGKLTWASLFTLMWLTLFGVMDERGWAVVLAFVVFGFLAFICAVSESAAERRARDAKGSNP
jgi:hypothetical protein